MAKIFNSDQMHRTLEVLVPFLSVQLNGFVIFITGLHRQLFPNKFMLLSFLQFLHLILESFLLK